MLLLVTFGKQKVRKRTKPTKDSEGSKLEGIQKKFSKNYILEAVHFESLAKTRFHN